jgi:signal peptidase II
MTLNAPKSRRGTAVRAGFLVAVITLILDQVSKHWILDWVKLTEDSAPIVLAPFAEFKFVWNRGISYGLFQQGTDFGRWLLVGISIAAAIALIVWLMRVEKILVGAAIGFIIAGAIGNAIDRAVYGAVIDFIYVHFAILPFWRYVFNIADAAIVAGVAGLLYDSVLQGRQSRGNTP